MIDLVARHWPDILFGLLATCGIVGIGFAIGALLGTGLTFLLISRHQVPRWLGRAYVELIRNTPFLIQAMLLFAILGVLRVRMEPMVVGAAAVTIYTSAYMAEIVRGALHSVPRGQWDAARALALPRYFRFRRVILPQLIPFVLPASVNLLATITKESAFLSAVSVAELTYAGQVIIAQTFRVFEVWAIVGVLYLAVVWAVLIAARHLEQRLRWATAARG